MLFTGRVHRLGDNINTDYILPGKYKFQSFDLEELVSHLFEDIDPGHYRKVHQGDILVAGRNFGCGSSREVAPLLLQYAGYRAVIAQSFGRIFYRNAITIGLPVLNCETGDIKEGDLLQVNLVRGEVKIIERGIILQTMPLPGFMIEILSSGGLLPFLEEKNKKF
ncbi:3-isopropylmalate dehydratase [Neomoorella mulderi]|uniref:3-isopropylmalate dehydratase small subunit n=1 Tax=Moorella mulderi DSM 14980 TaxID=1122241 RepID=A0A151AV62_9FIRM|nr:3-isopropylmalate dehydratase [Moorella mulderi]KYH31287.1 2,3-dimethylmalate dehydratase small subunit [Moorella mulderi DSM 14980]